jgi:hypothetical protein
MINQQIQELTNHVYNKPFTIDFIKQLMDGMQITKVAKDCKINYLTLRKMLDGDIHVTDENLTNVQGHIMTKLTTYYYNRRPT